jgi:hypothetical protein
VLQSFQSPKQQELLAFVYLNLSDVHDCAFQCEVEVYDDELFSYVFYSFLTFDSKRLVFLLKITCHLPQLHPPSKLQLKLHVFIHSDSAPNSSALQWQWPLFGRHHLHHQTELATQLMIKFYVCHRKQADVSKKCSVNART